jgi:hypothetical protein
MRMILHFGDPTGSGWEILDEVWDNWVMKRGRWREPEWLQRFLLALEPGDVWRG